MIKLYKKVELDIRKNGSEENLVSVQADIYDMSAYVDVLRKIIVDGIGDYILITPLYDKSFFDVY